MNAIEGLLPEESSVNNYGGSTPDIIPKDSHSDPPSDDTVEVDHHGNDNETDAVNPDILPTT